MSRLFSVETRQPWLIVRFASRWRTVGWSLTHPGFAAVDTIAWLEVCDADLPLGVDPIDLLNRRLDAAGLGGALGLMTARDIRRHHCAMAGDGEDQAEALVTLGLTNGAVLCSDGVPRNVMTATPVGTINLLVAVARPLSEAALLEALSMATMARTAALLAEDGRIVGTGTDCIVIACPASDSSEPDSFAGLHTPIGQAIVTAVFQATRLARETWEHENPQTLALSRSIRPA
ncbi:adenosylcobinamide amidohydrolase [Magnetospirillum molischianum]|uniref:Adenosylcobinamide amidohydrolase n=1 Tax=Magnetospirillum molischianum DSM 120 TaxID=1150626 RepID=H8FSS9_MAGML|nr:adenosylcobinamide amidohydrolase [Magnetospirillum molischianum]CCG41417.1 conserved hypothetical protein [Magnetospirillum molischianum DSM 120]